MSRVEELPSAPYPKLPFWEAVRLSYMSFFRQFAELWRPSWLWLIVVAVISDVANWQKWSWIAHMAPGQRPNAAQPMEVTVLLQLENAVSILAGVSIAVAWHRLLILKEHPGFSGSNLLTANLWRFVVVGIALGLIFVLPMFAVKIPVYLLVMPEGGLRLNPLLLRIVYLAVVAAGMAIAVRLCLLLPARAIGNTLLTFRQTWDRTRGNAWRLFWGLVFTSLTPLMAAEIIFVFTLGAPRPDAALDQDFVTKITAINTIVSAYDLLILPIGVGFLSLAYRHFFEKPLEQAG